MRMSSLANAMYFPQALLDFFTPQPRVPQFIYDTRHPWLEKNRTSLEGLPNPAYELCNGTLQPGLNDVPEDLFKRLEINNNRAGIDRAGWHNAAKRVKEMLECPLALESCETFEVEIYVHQGPYSDMILREPGEPPPDLPWLFAQLLESMLNLTTLQWNTFDNGNEDFRHPFENLTLPSVKRLKPPKNMEFLINMCPNIEHLDLEGHPGSWAQWTQDDPVMDMINAVSYARLENLTRFSLDGRWRLDHLQALLRTAPQLTAIDIGLIEEWRSSYGNEDAGNGYYLQQMLVILKQFPRLAHLQMPGANNLDLGWSGGPGCGNVYFGREGRKYGRQVSTQGAKAAERAAEMTLAVLPGLETLSIGQQCASLTKENGTTIATWPWTGRMTEWTFEVWPETGIEEDKW